MKDPTSHDATDSNRRTLLKLGLASGVSAAGMGAITPTTQAQVSGTHPGPYLQPFIDALPIAAIKATTTLVPAPARLPVQGEAGRDAHQRFEQFRPQLHYELRALEARHRFHAQLPEESVWAYDGQVPGPTFVNRVGVPVAVRIHNALPQNHVGFGSPEIITHLHSGHTGPSSDGFAADYYSATKAGPGLRYPGTFLDHHYPHFPANGDPRNITNTLWYHDHREDFTGPNVYKGLAGFYLLFDERDTNNETTGLRLPAPVGRYDIPLLLQDKKFDASGRLVYDQFNPEGFVGNHFLVNGKVQPYFRVEARKYRFRMVNASMARYMEMYVTDSADRNQNYTLIATDGNLLERSLTITKIFLGMAERADIIVDFSRYAPGTILYLVNRIKQDDPRKPENDRLYPGIRMLRFEVGQRTRDDSLIPALLRPMAPADPGAVITRRTFRFERMNGQWAINDRFFNPERVDAVVKQNVPEIWRFEVGGGWVHPVHVHLEDFRILSIGGKPPPPEWRGRKDTVSLLDGQAVEILVVFRDFTGKYLMHCHQHAHEDNTMMVRFDVVP